MQRVILAAILLTLGSRVDAGTLNAASSKPSDINAQITNAPATGQTTILVPAGTNPADAQILVTNKNIEIIGVEGQTQINLSSSFSPALNVSLNKEVTSGYSFRVSGIKFVGGDRALKITGNTNFSSVPTPIIPGCVARVRIDHCEFTNNSGPSIFLESVLGVADHIKIHRDAGSYVAIQVYHTKWTPITGTNNVLETNALGSWADDAYWGDPDRSFYFEDMKVDGAGYTNLCDNEQGGRMVLRHSTIGDTTGGSSVSVATHGNEGRPFPGVRAMEIYNNNFIGGGGGLAQIRSGNVLLFNNLYTNYGAANQPLATYRSYTTYDDWGRISGNNRYDTNDPSWTGTNVGAGGVCTGTVASVTNAQSSTITITLNTPNCLAAVASGIAADDGYTYAIVNTDDVSKVGATKTENGWHYRGNCILAVNAATNTITDMSTYISSAPDHSSFWAVGNHYEIRRVSNVFGQFGSGKISLLKMVGGSGYTTYDWPSTGPTKANDPQGATAHKEPSYSWNNESSITPAPTQANPNPTPYPIDFNVQNGVRSIKMGRDVFNLSQRAYTTQFVGYSPTTSYAHATASYPSIIKDPGSYPSTSTYTPAPYPHHLTNSTDPQITSAPGATFSTGTATDCNANPKVNCFQVTTANIGGTVTFSKTGTLPSGVTLNPASGIIQGIPTGATQTYSIAITATNGTDSATQDPFILTVQSPNAVPTVTLDTPANGSVYTAPAVIAFSATPNDDGAISKVEFYHGGTNLIGTANAPGPYTYTWTQVPAATYSLTAKAYDNLNATGTSSAKTVTVNPSPTPGTTPSPAVIQIK